MKRSYYSETIQNFLIEPGSSILGKMMINHTNRSLEELQRNAWKSQIQILKKQLKNFEGKIYFEFTIPRMGKRVDNIIIISDTVFVVEFKVGDGTYGKNSIEQVLDYTVDLKNFHEGSHDVKLIPVLISTKAEKIELRDGYFLGTGGVIKGNENNISEIITKTIEGDNEKIDIDYWENSVYKPTPTIIEAAQALYKGHSVEDITRSDSGTINLSKTTECINSIIENSKNNNLKSICFVTGVPGAGKTLAGLNIAVDRTKIDKNEHAVFLSGNGPLVQVLREALAQDLKNNKKGKISDARREVSSFVQNIHHFRDDNLQSKKAPVEKVVVFDEAQRAWTEKKVSTFMKIKKGIENFDMSEPQFLTSVLDRHSDWSTIVCLIGGGQEINSGEAGLEEWISSLKEYFPEWKIHYSNNILDNNNYLKLESSKKWLVENGINNEELHLGVSVRSFRSEKLSSFIYNLLEIEEKKAKDIYMKIKDQYPVVVTRDLIKAKKWLREQSKGSERIGVIGSSGARRLRAVGVDVKNEISPPNWFLKESDDIRSSNFLEDIATEFDIQGLEIDWACVAWGGNFHIVNDNWEYLSFKGSKWQNINKEVDKEYLKNTYRVLLTRARQGMVIFIPEGSDIDKTRPEEFYNGTFEYLKLLGIKEI